MPDLAVGTIVAKNFLSYARVLAASLRQHHPDIPFFVVLADEVDGMFDPALEPFEVIPLADLGIQRARHMCFWYDRAELSIVSKPYLLGYLLDRQHDAALFVDADMLILGSLARLFHATRTHSIVLTPHLVGPLSSRDRAARELNILQSGIYNGGCIGVSSTEAG